VGLGGLSNGFIGAMLVFSKGDLVLVGLSLPLVFCSTDPS
jgi:hypothetical protein